MTSRTGLEQRVSICIGMSCRSFFFLSISVVSKTPPVVVRAFLYGTHCFGRGTAPRTHPHTHFSPPPKKDKSTTHTHTHNQLRCLPPPFLRSTIAPFLARLYFSFLVAAPAPFKPITPHHASSFPTRALEVEDALGAGLQLVLRLAVGEVGEVVVVRRDL